MELSGLHFSLLGNYPSESRHELCEILFRDGFNGRAWVETKFVALPKIIALSSPHQLLLSSLRSGETSPRYGNAVCDIWIFHEENKSCRRQQALRRRCDVWRKKAVVVNEEKRRKNPRKAHAVRSKKEKAFKENYRHTQFVATQERAHFFLNSLRKHEKIVCTRRIWGMISFIRHDMLKFRIFDDTSAVSFRIWTSCCIKIL